MAQEVQVNELRRSLDIARRQKQALQSRLRDEQQASSPSHQIAPQSAEAATVPGLRSAMAEQHATALGAMEREAERLRAEAAAARAELESVADGVAVATEACVRDASLRAELAEARAAASDASERALRAMERAERAMASEQALRAAVAAGAAKQAPLEVEAAEEEESGAMMSVEERRMFVG